VRFHLGSAEVLGRLILLDHDELKPGQEGWAQIRLEEEILTERGDHFVLRSYSPMHTIAGGVVVTAGVGKRRRFREEDLEALRQAERGTPEERVLAVLQRRGGQGGDVAVLAKESGCTALEVEQALEKLCSGGQAVRISKRLVAANSGYQEAAVRLEGIIAGHQRGNPLSWGLSKSELKKRVESGIPAELVDHWLQRAVEGGTVFVRNDRLRTGSDRLDLKPEHELLRGAVLDVIAAASFEGRKQNELLEDIQARLLGGRLTGEAAGRLKALPAEKLAADTEALLHLLTDSGELTRVPPHFYYSSTLLAEAVQRVRAFFATHPEMKVADLKDVLGVSRKQAVPLLEYLDQARITQRQGDLRVPGSKFQAAEAGEGDAAP
jgi:selenocysteine-specific elongation factor